MSADRLFHLGTVQLGVHRSAFSFMFRDRSRLVYRSGDYNRRRGWRCDWSRRRNDLHERRRGMRVKVVQRNEATDNEQN